MNTHPVLHWNEAGAACSARWRSERGTPPHKKVVIADDRMTADAAYHHACEGTALLWRGDFQNARQLLTAEPVHHASPAKAGVHLHKAVVVGNHRANALRVLTFGVSAHGGQQGGEGA